MKYRLLYLFIFLGMLPFRGISQHTLKGIILDADKKPIPNVQVKVKNVSVETQSDKNGAFEIFAPLENTLIFKKKGFKRQHVKVKNYEPLKVVMKTTKRGAVPNENITLKGRVLEDGTGEPLIGASILIIGTTYGTVTDIEGRFELQLKKGDQIEINYMQCWDNAHNIHTITTSEERDFIVN